MPSTERNKNRWKSKSGGRKNNNKKKQLEARVVRFWIKHYRCSLSALKLIMMLDKNPFLFNIFTLVCLEMWQIVSCCQIIMRKMDYVYSIAPPVNDVCSKQQQQKKAKHKQFCYAIVIVLKIARLNGTQFVRWSLSLRHTNDWNTFEMNTFNIWFVCDNIHKC